MNSALILDKYFISFMIIFLLLLVTLFKIIYFNFFFKDDKNWFKKSIKLDLFGEYVEGHWISTAFFSYLQILMVLYFLGRLIFITFNLQSFLFGFYTPFLLLLIVYGIVVWIKKNRSYYFLQFFADGKVNVFITIMLENIPEKRNGVDIRIQQIVDEVVDWAGNYWTGILINEKMILDRRINFSLYRKYGIKNKYLQILLKILDYAVEKDISISIFSLVKFPKDFQKKTD